MLCSISFLRLHLEGAGVRAPSTVVDSAIPGVDVISSANLVVPVHPVPDRPISPFAPAVPTSSIETVGAASTLPASVLPTVKTSPVSRPRRSSVGNWKDGPAKDKAGAYETARTKDQHFLAKLVEVVIPRDAPSELSAMKASLRQALKDDNRRSAILQSIGAEIDNLEAPGVLQPVRYQDIPSEFRADIIGVYMFHREKFKADGTFEKDKTRIVLLSNRRDPSTIGETHCPTVYGEPHIGDDTAQSGSG